MDLRKLLGRTGERQAERHLRRKRYRTVARNYVCPLGEIDLVMLDGDTVVFIEVKTRADAVAADPQDAVNRAKQERIGRCARFFLRQTRSEDRACRFDVIAAVSDGGGKMRIEHWIDAFTPVE